MTKPLRILVVNTKVPKNTKALVAGVRSLRESLPDVIDPILAAIEAISQQFVLTAACAEPAGSTTESSTADAMIARLVSLNQHLLCALGVGHASLDALVATCAKYVAVCLW